MNKLFVFLLLILSTNYVFAQEPTNPRIVPPTDAFPDVNRALIHEEGTYTCDPCYTWTQPFFNHFKSAYGDTVITIKDESSHYWSPHPLGTNLLSFYGKYLNSPFGYSMSSPVIFLNNNFRYKNPNDAIYRLDMHGTIDSFIATPTVVSPLFTSEKYGTDSFVVHTYSKFIHNAPAADYRVTVLLIQDSIFYRQAGAPTDPYCHMSVLKGPGYYWLPNNNNPIWQTGDSLNYTLANGPVSAGTIINKSFYFKLDSMQDLAHMRPLVLITKYDTAALTYDYTVNALVTFPRHVYINANEKEWIPGNRTAINIKPDASKPYEASLYPNPTSSGKVTVHLTGLPEKAEIKIYDLLGKVVLSKLVCNGESLSVSALAPSTYAYQFLVAGKVVMQAKIEISNR